MVILELFRFLIILIISSFFFLHSQQIKLELNFQTKCIELNEPVRMKVMCKTKYNEQKNKDKENGERLVDYEKEEEWVHLHSIQLNCLLNLSAVELKRQRYKRCVEICNEVLRSDKDNVKAIFRQGQANVALKNFDLGLEYFKRARRLQPHDEKIIEEIRRVKKSMKDYSNFEKQTFAKMFSK